MPGAEHGPQAGSVIVMLGPAVHAKGGIASVIASYQAGGLFARQPIRHLVTHEDAGAARKLAVAAAALARFTGLVVRGRVRLLHAHVAARLSFWRKTPFMLLAMALRVPVVLHVHSGEFPDFHAKPGLPGGRALIRFLVTRAAAVIVLQPVWREWVAQTFGRADAVIIGNGVSLPASMPEGPREPLVVYLGRISEKKGAFDLITAFARLAAASAEHRLVIAGSGEIAAAQDLARSLGVADRVSFPGWIDAAEKSALLSRAQIFALPSHFEAQSISLIEAMAHGCAVVACAVGGVPDVVTSERTGLLVPPRDPEALGRALIRLSQDPALGRSLGAAAMAAAHAEHGLTGVIDALDALYARLPGRGAR